MPYAGQRDRGLGIFQGYLAGQENKRANAAQVVDLKIKNAMLKIAEGDAAIRQQDADRRQQESDFDIDLAESQETRAVEGMETDKKTAGAVSDFDTQQVYRLQREFPEIQPMLAGAGKVMKELADDPVARAQFSGYVRKGVEAQVKQIATQRLLDKTATDLATGSFGDGTGANDENYAQQVQSIQDQVRSGQLDAKDAHKALQGLKVERATRQAEVVRKQRGGLALDAAIEMSGVSPGTEADAAAQATKNLYLAGEIKFEQAREQIVQLGMPREEPKGGAKFSDIRELSTDLMVDNPGMTRQQALVEAKKMIEGMSGSETPRTPGRQLKNAKSENPYAEDWMKGKRYQSGTNNTLRTPVTPKTDAAASAKPFTESEMSLAQRFYKENPNGTREQLRAFVESGGKAAPEKLKKSLNRNQRGDGILNR